MRTNDITSTLWRRRILFGVTFATSLIVVAILTAVVPKVYRATSTVYIAVNQSGLDATQADQLTRTYSTLASNPNVADSVLAQLGGKLTRKELLSKMSFTPVERTQLLDISAEDQSPTQAQKIANTYADGFVSQVASQQAAGKAPASVALSQSAVEPTDPVRPNPPVYIGVGGVLALLLATGVALAAERFDKRIRVRPGDETAAGQPILGRIPVLREQPADGSGSEALRTDRVLGADAVRLLRTNIDMAAEESPRTITVTSPGAGEGKSTIASQLALTLATDGDRVTLVECDLRRGALGGIGLRGRSSPGLAEYLAGQATAKKAITRTTSMHGLRIVWAGAALAEPGPLLRSPRFPEFLTGLERTQDWVILDTPPIGVGDDALVVSAHSDATLVVISHDMTTGPALEAGLSKLRRVRAHVLGVVLNRAPKVATDAYGYLLESPVRELAAPEAARTRGDRSSSMPAAGERSADDSAARGDI